MLALAFLVVFFGGLIVGVGLCVWLFDEPVKF
jgi:hypothetical protein